MKEFVKNRDIPKALEYEMGDKIILCMHDLAKKEFGIDVSIVDRRNIVYSDGKYDEVNIYAEGKKNGKSSFIIGECKSRPAKRILTSSIR